MNRRQILLGTALMGVGLLPLLPGCASFDPTVTKIITDATAIDTGLTNLMPTLTPLIPASVAAQVTLYLGYIKTALDTLKTTPTVAAAQTPVQQIQTYANALIAAVLATGVSLPATVTTAFTAVQTLLPIILADIGMVALAPSKSPPMTEAQALAVLTAH